eukprot:Skav222304  [mRNA]  locus=scaffold3734:343457:347762:- [translate_table: standard]
MTVPYNGNLFRFSVFLVMCNRLAAVIFAIVMAYAKGEGMTNQVSFAVQMLGKSFKMMPVMIWGMIISGKSYRARDWCVAFAVTLGCTEFLMTGPTGSKAGWWVTLLVLGDLVPALHFALAHPKFILDATWLSGSAVASQWCIYSQIKEFGALVFAATMSLGWNVRQVVSILVSYMKYHNPVTGLQIVGLVAIFAALFYKSLISMIETKATWDGQGRGEPMVMRSDGWNSNGLISWLMMGNHG